MKKSALKLIKISLIFFFICVGFSCSNSIDSILSDYNSEFGHISTKHFPKPGDGDFNQADMISPTYTAYKFSSFAVPAPSSCTSYLWVFYSYDKETSTKTELLRLNSKDFFLEVPMVKDLEGNSLKPGTYGLDLTVKDSAGNEYKDSAEVYIVESLE